MSGTNAAYNKGRDDARAGKLYNNPFDHFTLRDNACRYDEGYASGRREYNAGLTKASRNATVWKPMPVLDFATRGMSHDRVVFTLLPYMFNTEAVTARTGELLFRVFGINDRDWAAFKHRAVWQKPTRIVCRPSQFARFLIQRHELGMQNMFKELEAKLHGGDTIPDADWDVDVSRNKA